MKVLVWKDCRVNRFVLILGTAVVLAPYVVGVIIGIYAKWQHGIPWWDFHIAGSIAVVSFSLLLVTMAMLGGNAFAAERVDRSAEFLAYLPPSRWTLAASKMIVALGASLCGWVLNLLNLFVLAPRLHGAPELIEEYPKEELLLIAALAALMFGVAWCFSSFVASPAIATGCGFFAPIVAGGVTRGLQYFFHPAGFSFGLWWYSRFSLTVGIVAFVVGTLVYVRRVEP